LNLENTENWRGSIWLPRAEAVKELFIIVYYYNIRTQQKKREE